MSASVWWGDVPILLLIHSMAVEQQQPLQRVCSSDFKVTITISLFEKAGICDVIKHVLTSVIKWSVGVVFPPMFFFF